MASDEELLRRFAAGERAALGELAGRYEVSLLNLALPMLGSRELAMDAVQETWLRVIRYAGTFNSRSSVKTWLYRIAINQCRSARAAQVSPPLQGGARGGLDGETARNSRQSAEATARGLPESAGSNENDPNRQAAQNEQNDSLKHAVEQLPPDLREVILLCYMQGLTHSEAAEALEVPIGTVKSRVHAALEQLRSRVKS